MVLIFPNLTIFTFLLSLSPKIAYQSSFLCSSTFSLFEKLISHWINERINIRRKERKKYFYQKRCEKYSKINCFIVCKWNQEKLLNYQKKNLITKKCGKDKHNPTRTCEKNLLKEASKIFISIWRKKIKSMLINNLRAINDMIRLKHAKHFIMHSFSRKKKENLFSEMRNNWIVSHEMQT